VLQRLLNDPLRDKRTLNERDILHICIIVLSISSKAKRCDAIHEAKIVNYIAKTTRTGGRKFCRFVKKLLKGGTHDEIKRLSFVVTWRKVKGPLPTLFDRNTEKTRVAAPNVDAMTNVEQNVYKLGPHGKKTLRTAFVEK